MAGAALGTRLESEPRTIDDSDTLQECNVTTCISGGLAGVLIGLAAVLPASADENTGLFAGASLGYSLLEAAEDIEIGDVQSEFELDDEIRARHQCFSLGLGPIPLGRV